jgi:hypothetical protein
MQRASMGRKIAFKSAGNMGYVCFSAPPVHSSDP